MFKKKIIVERAHILSIAKQRDYFVPKYGHRFEALRKVTRRMLSEGLLKKVGADGRGFYYRAGEQHV